MRLTVAQPLAMARPRLSPGPLCMSEDEANSYLAPSASLRVKLLLHLRLAEAARVSLISKTYRGVQARVR